MPSDPIEHLRRIALDDPALLARLQNTPPDNFASALLELAGEEGLCLSVEEIAEALRRSRRAWIESQIA